MKDTLVIAEALNGQVRIHIASTTQLVEQARLAHDMFPTSCAALGRVMTINALMASDLKKPHEKVVVHIDGKGPVGTIVSQADGQGNVRAFVSDPQVYLFRENDNKLDVGKAVGTHGALMVTKDLGLKEPFTGMVDLQTGEIGDDFAFYFATSEQTPSVVALGVLVNPDYSVKAAGGMLLQLLPNATEETIEAVENLTRAMKPMSSYIDMDMKPEEILHTLFEDAKVLGEKDIRWYCGCSRDHYFNALSLLREHDLQEMIEEDHGCEIVCQYCGTKYAFDEGELKLALEHKKTCGK